MGLFLSSVFFLPLLYPPFFGSSGSATLRLFLLLHLADSFGSQFLRDRVALWAESLLGLVPSPPSPDLSVSFSTPTMLSASSGHFLLLFLLVLCGGIPASAVFAPIVSLSSVLGARLHSLLLSSLHFPYVIYSFFESLVFLGSVCCCRHSCVLYC